ncbi:MAG: YciI family protein [Alphaproteobacteria bacterium]|jgi:uncharacterized protein YciI
METSTYLFYCRDNPDTRELRQTHREAHWAFMDGYADRMVARGPTLADDGQTPTGSMHAVELPDEDAARVFAFEEPNYKAGIYGDVMIRRWTNALKRTMWEFEGDPERNRRFLFLGHGADNAGVTDRRNELLQAHRDFLAPPEKMRQQILRGPLWDISGGTWTGSLFLLEAPDRDAATAFFDGEPYTNAGLYVRTELHEWRFGGRH